MKELIERLREDTGDGARSIGEIMCEAADFIEQQAAEIELLKERDDLLSSARDKLRINTSAEIHGYIAERDAALAKLSAMELVEPVAWMHIHGNHSEVSERCLTDHEKSRGWTETPLYTAPKVAQPSKPTFAEWCATNWDGPPSANARDAYNRIIGGQHG